METIAVYTGQENSVQLMTEPAVSDIPNDRGVLLKVLRTGVDRAEGACGQGANMGRKQGGAQG